MTTFITYTLFSSRTGEHGHCFLNVTTYVMDGAKVLACCENTRTGNTEYERRSLLIAFRDFLHASDNGAERESWVHNDEDGAVYGVQKVWRA